MSMKAIVKGISVGATVGTACFMLVRSGERKKRSIKRHAGKMLRAAGAVLDDFTSVMR